MNNDRQWNCPVCNRPHSGKGECCARCGADLMLYENAIEKHATLLQHARKALQYNPEISVELSSKAADIHKTVDTYQMQAVAAICCRNYKNAMRYLYMTREALE